MMTAPAGKPVSLIALVIENDATQRALITLGLARMGCSVITAKDSDDARSLLEEKHPSLLVLDTYLPKTNGIDLLHQFKSAQLLTKCVVIMISSYGFEEVVQQAIQAGAHDFLVKPIDVDLLIQRARMFLDRMKA